MDERVRSGRGIDSESWEKTGRGDRIRTCDLMVPNHARYQLRYTPMRETRKEEESGVADGD